MHSLYALLLGLARRFFSATGIPIPSVARRANRRLKDGLGVASMAQMSAEIAAIARAVQRLETAEYLDRIGRRDE